MHDVINDAEISLDCATFKMVSIHLFMQELGERSYLVSTPIFIILYKFDGIRSVKINISITCVSIILCTVLAQPALIM